MEEKKDPADDKVQGERRQAGGTAIVVVMSTSMSIVAAAIRSAALRRCCCGGRGPCSRPFSIGAPPSDRSGAVDDQGIRQHRRKGHDLSRQTSG